MSTNDPQAKLDAIRAAFLQLSPSAAYELRREAIEQVNRLNPDKTPRNKITGWRPRWWDNYPRGCTAAFVFRVATILDMPPWEEQGEELPPFTYYGQPR